MAQNVLAQPFSSRHQQHDFDMFSRLRTANRDSAYIYAERLISDLDTTTLSADVAMVYDFMSEYAEGHLHQYRNALNYRLQSARIYRGLGDDACLTRTNALLGRIYLRNDNYHDAFSCSIEALRGAEMTGDITSMREAYLVLERVTYFYHNDLEVAMEYNSRVADDYNNREQAHQTIRALNNRFNYPLSAEEMVAIMERSEALCKEYGFNDLLINVYLNGSMLALSYEDFDGAKEYLGRAFPLLSNFKEEGYYYSASAFYHLNCGNSAQAIADITRSIELLGEGDFDSKNIHSYFLLQDIYRAEGRYREAYEALMLFAEIYTRQHNAENIVELSSLINQLEVERTEQLRREEQMSYEQERKHHRLMMRIYIAGLVLMVVVAMLLLSRYRLQRKNHKLLNAKAEQELNYKSEIIKIQRLQQFEKQKNIDAILEELNAVVSATDIREMRNELRRVIRHLQQGDASGGDWAEVEKTLLSNDTFFDNLLKEYPNLTKNERKLCTFIHMNLSTKEIANITHQSTGSINVARSRLRQKFGLTDSDMSLIAFLDRFKTPAE
ncbi:MAG: hypothetical protein J6U93_02690 [Alistipes sp.]|nr:hypothetical protein [Alistipes sp.]